MTRPAQQARALHLYLTGQEQQAIALEVGVSENTITSWKQRFGWDAQVAQAHPVRAALLNLAGAVQQQQQQHHAAAQQWAAQAGEAAAHAAREVAHAQAVQTAFGLVCTQLGYPEVAGLAPTPPDIS